VPLENAGEVSRSKNKKFRPEGNIVPTWLLAGPGAALSAAVTVGGGRWWTAAMPPRPSSRSMA
jgi:hypothetical protein